MRMRSEYLRVIFFFFFFNDTATTEIYTLSLHDALPISTRVARCFWSPRVGGRESHPSRHFTRSATGLKRLLSPILPTSHCRSRANRVLRRRLPNLRRRKRRIILHPRRLSPV